MPTTVKPIFPGNRSAHLCVLAQKTPRELLLFKGMPPAYPPFLALSEGVADATWTLDRVDLLIHNRGSSNSKRLSYHLILSLESVSDRRWEAHGKMEAAIAWASCPRSRDGHLARRCGAQTPF